MCIENPYYTADGCESNSTIISSTSGDPELAITIIWPEIRIGTTAYVDCPCGNLSLTSDEIQASRYCGGNFTHGAVWDEPHVADCNFTDLTRNICRIASVSYKIINFLNSLTSNKVSNICTTGRI